MREKSMVTAAWALAGADANVLTGIPPAPKPAASLQAIIAYDLGGGVKLDLVLIHPGKYRMGGRNTDDEKPVHEVTISKAFYIGKYDVTQEQYKAVMKNDPSNFKGPKNPAERVTWDEAQTFCKNLSATSSTTVRLPTEAEWEYACRAGSTTTYCFGDSEDGLAAYAWYSGNANDTTHPVGEKKPNAWGLYDMHWNVWNWCVDWYDANYYASSPKIDPPGPASGTEHVVRGGSWHHGVTSARSACRYHFAPELRHTLLGFRVVVDVPKRP